MKKLEHALEQLDEMISTLEERVETDLFTRGDSQKKTAEQLRQSRAREAGVLAVAQKVAARLDQTIVHVEKVLR